jgi:hypothetical protein
MTLPIDPGTPIPASQEGAERGLMLYTTVCSGATCPRLHLDAIEVDLEGDAARVTQDGGAQKCFDLDTATGKLHSLDVRAEQYVASEQGAWLLPWTESHLPLLRNRFEHLKGQRADEPADARPAPAWKPSVRVTYGDLFPYAFTPTIKHGGEHWAIVDACCPDPACGCEDVVLTFFPTSGHQVQVTGRLGDPRPTGAKTTGKELWRAVHADPDLLAELQARHEEIRDAGPFIVGAAYEQQRLATHATREAITEGGSAGGYLRGGAIPLELVQRLFDAGARFNAARFALFGAWPAFFRVEVSGAVTRDAWGLVDDDPAGVDLYAALADTLPWLAFAVADRSTLDLQHRRQRCALGLPLIGGTSLPRVDRVRPDEQMDPPDANDVRLALAVIEALLAAPRDDAEGMPTEPRLFEHRVDLDVGAVDVRLTASPPEAPWVEEEHGDDASDDGDGDHAGDHDGDRDHDGDHDGDHDEDCGCEHAPDDDDAEDDGGAMSVVVEAFTDSALHRGLADDVVSTASSLLETLGQFAAGTGGAWFDDRVWVRFLEDYAPRELLLDEQDVALFPRALRAVAGWLEEAGHGDPRRLRAALERALPVFRKRSQDPRLFSPVKVTFEKMRAAGIDLSDEAAVERFIAEKKAEQRSSGPSSLGAADVPRVSHRWRPAEGEAPPAPTEPCGCGSGRRYKKCCMPR